MCTQRQLNSACSYGGFRQLCVGLFAFTLLSVSSDLQADDAGQFSIRDAHVWHDEQGWFMDAQCTIRLSAGAQEALENGVPLVFELRAQIVRKHNWLWDKVEHERTLMRQIQYHALSRSYLVKELDTGTQGVYSRVVDALHAVGLIDTLLLTDGTLRADREYLVRLRGTHDIESLPTPVRLLAYVSSAWDMNSEWYAWPLAR